MDLTVDGDVQPDTRHAADAESQARDLLPPEPSAEQVVVGDIPLESPGFLPRPAQLAELDRAVPGYR